MEADLWGGLPMGPTWGQEVAHDFLGTHTPEATILNRPHPFLSTRQASPLVWDVWRRLLKPLSTTTETSTAAKSVMIPNPNTSHGVPHVHLLPIVGDPRINSAILKLLNSRLPLHWVYPRVPSTPFTKIVFTTQEPAVTRATDCEDLNSIPELRNDDTDGDVHPS